MTNNKQPTMSDIARLANVSESTVSRALKNNPAINAKTRERIQRIAAENHYVINEAARNLRTRRSHTIAVALVIPGDAGQKASDPFIMEILGSIAGELQEFGYDMLLTFINEHSYREKGVSFTRQVEGIIFIGQGATDIPTEVMKDINLPYIVWGADRGDSEYTIVGSDNQQGGYLAVKHLLNQGRKSILFIGDLSHPEVAMRYRGYMQAYIEQDLPVDKTLTVTSAFTSESGYLAMEAFTRQGRNSIDAVFAASDLIALGAIKCLAENGVSVPADIAVVGFDNIPLANYSFPPLTTIAQNTAQGGKMLVTQLLSAIKHEPDIASVNLNTRLIVRQSSTHTKT